ncbi:MAG TPA: class C sortase [Microbacteriaceae bacterium]|nr:class C sortase [Microbacteriaceae bacterium]
MSVSTLKKAESQDYEQTANSPLTHRVRASRPQKQKILVPVLIQIVTFFGLATLLYPSAADWFATLNHNAEISGYIQNVEQLEVAGQQENLLVAQEYNSNIPPGMLRDPYSTNAAAEAAVSGSSYDEYLKTMLVGESSVIGEISYPRLKVDLPIYHGTTDEVISKGAGHLYGSSLPIGGASTHTLLTAHSGLAKAPLFTPVLEAQIGDVFHVTSLGETRYYEVEAVQTILPEETAGLGIVDGADLATLITCTPLGSNTHRLLVQGVRIPPPDTKKSADEIVIAGDGKQAGFPWWALGFIGGNAVVATTLFAKPKRQRPRLKKTDNRMSRHENGISRGKSERSL